MAAHPGVAGVSREPTERKPGLTPDDVRRRRSRSIAIAVALALLVVLFYAVTVVKLGPQILNRPM
jgi:hypothetical protein